MSSVQADKISNVARTTGDDISSLPADSQTAGAGYVCAHAREARKNFASLVGFPSIRNLETTV